MGRDASGLAKALLEQLAQHHAQIQAAGERDEAEASMMAEGAGQRSMAVAREDQNVQALVLTGVPYGNHTHKPGHQIEGLSIACNMEASPAFMNAILANHIP